MTKKVALSAYFFCLSFMVVFFFSFFQAHAYEIKDTNLELTGDFVLSPAKFEVSIDPGATTTRVMTVINRTRKTVHFALEIEDFRGSMKAGKTVVLLGQEVGPYSLKDYLHPEVSEFTLKPGQQVLLPVTIAIPSNAQPGGLYGSVLVHNVPAENAGGAQTISRLGALFFVRVNGDVVEEGALKDFRLAGDQSFYTGGPFAFEWIYENTGNVHTVPYGTITITNTLGNPIQKIVIDPYFALPNAIRYRKITWDKDFLLGHYTAVLELNRGYGDIVDTKKVSFWVIPWKWLGGGLLLVFLILLFGYLAVTRLEINVKKK